MRNCQLKLVMHVKYYIKMYLLKMSGTQIWLCLFTFRLIASKQLNGLTTIDILNWLSGAVVINASDLGARGPGFNPRLRQRFLCLIFCIVVVVFLLFCPKTHYLSQNIGIPFTMLIYLVYSTYCKICDRL